MDIASWNANGARLSAVRKHIPAGAGISNLNEVRVPRFSGYAHIAGYVFFHSNQEGRMSGCATGDLAKKFNITVKEATRKDIQISMTGKLSQPMVRVANIHIPPHSIANYNGEEAMQNLVKPSAADVLSGDMSWKPTAYMWHHLMSDDLPPLPRRHKSWRAKPCARARTSTIGSPEV